MLRKILWGIFILAIIFVVIAGGLFWWSTQGTPATSPVLAFQATTTTSTTSATAATSTIPGLPIIPVGPTSTGNIIDPGSGAPPIVGNNLMLGIDENSSLGTYLVGYNGETLYTYEKDTDASSTCYAACATTWPPYIVSSSDSINTQYGVNASNVSIITRTDGTLQVAYEGHPLYFYSGDTQETTNGQGMGGVWYVVMP